MIYYMFSTGEEKLVNPSHLAAHRCAIVLWDNSSEGHNQFYFLCFSLFTQTLLTCALTDHRTNPGFIGTQCVILHEKFAFTVPWTSGVV